MIHTRQVRPTMLLLGAALTLALSVGAGPVAASEGEQLEGSWFITITGTPFKILRTITPGGVVDAYAFPPITPTAGPLINSGGHGNWKKIGPRTYAVTVKYFQLNPARNATFDILDSVGTVRETIKVSRDGNTYTSIFETVIALPDGTPIIQNSGATVARRIRVEPLQAP